MRGEHGFEPDEQQDGGRGGDHEERENESEELPLNRDDHVRDEGREEHKHDESRDPDDSTASASGLTKKRRRVIELNGTRTEFLTVDDFIFACDENGHPIRYVGRVPRRPGGFSF